VSATRCAPLVCQSDCTHDGSRDLFDFLCFVNAFNAGC